MEITQELVDRIAHLARLTMTPEEKERMRTQLEEILGSMTALDRLTLEEDTDAQEIGGVLRADAVEQSAEPLVLLANAPEEEGGYVLVPGTIREEQG